MQHYADKPKRSHSEYVRHSEHQCPLCTAFLVRTPRRVVDRLWSVFKPVLRYRCERFSCQWHGNLPREAAGGDDLPGDNSHTAVRASVPVAFIVHMLLAASGAILVLVISNSEPLLLLEGFLRDAAWPLAA